MDMKISRNQIIAVRTDDAFVFFLLKTLPNTSNMHVMDASCMHGLIYEEIRSDINAELQFYEQHAGTQLPC